MCGVIGLVSKTYIEDRRWLIAGSKIISHRGPDDVGEWWSADGCVGLGHRRLSIIDLSETGHQPMSDLSGMFWIVFNGEIYNYRELRDELTANGIVFQSKSDTEVILAAYKEWGTECLSRLNGMFVFAIYDKHRRRLFIGRDRVGEKPLYFSHSNGALRFASEIKAFLVDPIRYKTIDKEALDCFLAMGYVPGERCILQDVNKLLPAHALSFDVNTGFLKKWRYWDIPEYQPEDTSGKINEVALLNELEELLEDSVNRQLIADVPVGVLLSGGVDSSIVTAMASKKSSMVKTFTIGFPGHGKLDETKHARLIARHFNTEHIELEAKELKAEHFLDLAKKFDEPIIDSSMIPTFLVSKLVREHCTVALGGDGGDELFGGYKHYDRLLWMQKYLGKIPRTLRRSASIFADKFIPLGAKGRNWLQGCGADFNQDIPQFAIYFDFLNRQRLMSNQEYWPFVAENVILKRTPVEDELLQRATRMDFRNFLVDDVLVKVDRTSMLNSLELRAPLLDYRLVEFAFGKVPTYLKATSNSRKVLLKKLASRILPREFNIERKQGFSIPINMWLKSGSAWRELFTDVLSDSESIFNKNLTQSLLNSQDIGRNNGERLFGLVLFEIWRREHGLAL